MKNRSRLLARFVGVVATTLLFSTLPVAAAEAPPAEDPNAEGRIEEIDQRLKILERKEELAKEKESEKAKESAKVGTGKDGMSISSADGAYLLRIRGYLQVDGAFFLDDQANPATDSIFLRRARPVFEGTVGKLFDFKLMPDFGQGKTVLYDAYIDLRFHPWTKVRVGKFKPPVGLERLQSATDTIFITRAAPTLLVPNRDIGLQLHGEDKEARFTYAAMISNGVPDGANLDGDTNNGKDLSLRIFAQPFKGGGPAALSGLGVGLAGTHGDNTGTASSPGLPSYKSPGDQTIFAYRSDTTAAGTAVADGTRWRFTPQAYWYFERVGALAEYVISSQEVRLGASAGAVENRAWQLAVSVLLTGDTASFKGVSPRKPYEAAKPGKGAVELAGRTSRLRVDDAAFPIFADPAKAIRAAEEWAAGVNWYVTRNVRISLNYDQTSYEGGAPGGADRETEKVVLSRFQVSF